MSEANQGDSAAGLELMLAEMESSCLEVVLVPCRREVNSGGCIRVALSKNCDWYRRFCGRHLSSRVRNRALPDTKIKRRAVVRLLNKLIAGRPTFSKYADELRRLAARKELAA